mmetsp:Transcript_67301/g.219210  ORF Transcript_67301/g.219210 Transcript_67301/m.219210 type:complete len:302 (+) Transcript_67301:465-1370(+)
MRLPQSGQQRILRLHVALGQYHGLLVERQAIIVLAQELALHRQVVVGDGQCGRLLPEDGFGAHQGVAALQRGHLQDVCLAQFDRLRSVPLGLLVPPELRQEGAEAQVRRRGIGGRQPCAQRFRFAETQERCFLVAEPLMKSRQVAQREVEARGEAHLAQRRGSGGARACARARAYLGEQRQRPLQTQLCTPQLRRARAAAGAAELEARCVVRRARQDLGRRGQRLVGGTEQPQPQAERTVEELGRGVRAARRHVRLRLRLAAPQGLELLLPPGQRRPAVHQRKAPLQGRTPTSHDHALRRP